MIHWEMQAGRLNPMARITSLGIRASIRRWRAAGPVAQITAVVVIAAAGWVLVRLSLLQASTDMARPDMNEAVREHAFWMTTLVLLIMSYTSFEVVFRAPGRGFLHQLPIRGQTHYWSAVQRVALWHAPLALPAIIYGLALRSEALTFYVVAFVGLLYMISVPLVVWLHLLAGRSLLGSNTFVKQYLAGGLTADKDAFLLYSPVAALAATLSIGIFVDLFLYESMITQRTTLWWAPVVGGLGIIGFCTSRSLELADRYFFAMQAAFNEADTPLPYREDGLPKQTPGQGWMQVLPSASRTYFLRDLRQLRRRYRVEKVLLWLYPFVLWRVAAGGNTANAAFLVCLTAVIAVLFAPAFRLASDVLASPWLEEGLPTRPTAHLTGRFGASLIYPMWAWLMTVVARVFTGTAGDTLWVAGLGIIAVIIPIGLTLLITHLVPRPRIALTAWTWRIASVGLVGLCAWKGTQ
jgi:hypothetical protein